MPRQGKLVPFPQRVSFEEYMSRQLPELSRTDDGDADSLAAPGAQTDAVVDMTALGFEDEIARPDELYIRYGAPEGDPAWRP